MPGKQPRFRRLPSPATGISVLALFVALGGVSYAAATIGSSQIRNNSVASVDIKNRAIRLQDLARQTRSGLRGARGPVGAAGPAGPAGRSALSNLASGERIYGTYGVQGQGPNLWTGVTFPVPAPTPVDSRHVVVANDDSVSGDGCSGTTVDPVSAPGYVCIYTHLAASLSNYGWGVRCACSDPEAEGDGSRFGFIVQATGGPGLITADGVWVYTAP